MKELKRIAPGRVVALGIALSMAGAAAAQAQSGRVDDERPAPTNADEQPLAPVVVTAPRGSVIFEQATPTTVLEGGALRAKVQPSLGETLANEPGAAASYFGPNASRPVIRGQEGVRVRVLANGIGVLDASALSPDHAVGVEPILLDRIEVVRGPAALLYGASPLTGLVNVTDGRIAQEPLAKPFNGSGELRYDTVNSGRSGAARLDAGNERVVVHADGFRRLTDDLRIPGDAWTTAVQARRGAAGPHGRLPNSDSSAGGGALGVSVLQDHGYTGLAWSGYQTTYGTVAEPNVNIELRQSRLDLAGAVRPASGSVQSIDYKLGYTDYEHKELDAGVVGTTFRNKGYDSRVEMKHASIGGLRGTVGLQMSDAKLSALGDEAFIPENRTRAAALFAYEETVVGDAKFSAAGRIAANSIAAEDFAATGAPAETRKFNTAGVALGTHYTLTPLYGIVANLAYTERAPSAQELYADGAHAATGIFEIGDRNIAKEKSSGIDLALRRSGDGWTGTLGVFYNRYEIITLMPTLDAATGQPLYRDGADRTLAASPDPVAAGFVEPMPQYRFMRVPAVFTGAEAQMRFPLWSAGGRKLALDLRADYTRARNRDTGEPLPRIAPLRWGGGLDYTRDRWAARLEALRAEPQKRLAAGETETAAYTLVNASVSRRLRSYGVDWEAFVRASNLLNETVRYHTSFLKDVAPLGARAVAVGLRAAF